MLDWSPAAGRSPSKTRYWVLSVMVATELLGLDSSAAISAADGAAAPPALPGSGASPLALALLPVTRSSLTLPEATARTR